MVFVNVAGFPFTIIARGRGIRESPLPRVEYIKQVGIVIVNYSSLYYSQVNNTVEESIIVL